jgi:hypothetical protein
MNRHERRALAKRNVTFVDYGHLSERDQNYGLPVECYVCGFPHHALGLARITDSQETIHVPLCEPCLGSDDRANTVIRKFLNAPDLEISEGGEATTEQVLAVADKRDATEH